MKRIILGMSGGTDSSVSAILLQRQGYTVIGITLRLWSDSDDFNNTQIPQYILDAQLLAKKLKIEHHIVDVKEDFYNKVIIYFRNEYLKGRTPNPCVKCNVVLKWKVLNEQAIKYKCNYIATGHYTQTEHVDGFYYIKKGNDPEKEQSFFLWGLNQEILSKIVFPLGGLNKTEVKQIALEAGFESVAKKKESIGVCFIDGGNYQPFLRKLMDKSGITANKGIFTDEEGKYIGEHDGYPFYTVGQRRGLGLSPNTPWYVSNINADNNTIKLCKRDDLYRDHMLVYNYNLINPNDLKQEIITKVRYRKQAARSIIEVIDDRILKVIFLEPEWSIAPGQTAAFYIDERLIGGGYIK